MANVFEKDKIDITDYWTVNADIKEAKLNTWKIEVEQVYLDRSISRLSYRMERKQMEILRRHHMNIIETAREKINTILKNMISSCIFMLVTVEGVVLEVLGEEELISNLDHVNNLGPGTLFTLPHTGINAITVARKLQEKVFLQGREHDLKLFEKWSCFCSPIRYKEEIIAYLDMSFSEREDHLLATSIFNITLGEIESTLNNSCPEVQREIIYPQFQQYKLSSREKEIGFYWLMNYSALRIASELGLAEGTVRNVLKNIYRKVEVASKGSFIRKFMIS